MTISPPKTKFALCIRVKKSVGKAIVRNKIRRRLKNIFAHHIFQESIYPSLSCIIIPNKSIVNLTFAKLKNEILSQFSKITSTKI